MLRPSCKEPSLAVCRMQGDFTVLQRPLAGLAILPVIIIRRRRRSRQGGLIHRRASVLDDSAVSGICIFIMNECTIRQAELADAPAIASLVTQMGYPASTREMTGRLKMLLSLPEYLTLVAEDKGIVVGLVGAYMGYSFEMSGMYGRLTTLVVDERYRGYGIGKHLIKKIESSLKDQGAVLLVVTSSSHRRKTHHFYRYVGYEETGLRFTKRLVER